MGAFRFAQYFKLMRMDGHIPDDLKEHPLQTIQQVPYGFGLEQIAVVFNVAFHPLGAIVHGDGHIHAGQVIRFPFQGLCGEIAQLNIGLGSIGIGKQNLEQGMARTIARDAEPFYHLIKGHLAMIKGIDAHGTHTGDGIGHGLSRDFHAERQGY